MILQFKIGTQPLIRHKVAAVPAVGSILYLPFPTGGGPYKVRIREIHFVTDKPSEAIYYGEWV